MQLRHRMDADINVLFLLRESSAFLLDRYPLPFLFILFLSRYVQQA